MRVNLHPAYLQMDGRDLGYVRYSTADRRNFSRLFAVPFNPQSQSQERSRLGFADVSQAWVNLTDLARANFVAAAAGSPGTRVDKYGDPYQLSGFQLFSGLGNVQGQATGALPTDVPDSWLAGQSPYEITGIDYNDIGGTIDISINHLAASGTIFQTWISPVLPAGRQARPTDFRLITTNLIGSYIDADAPGAQTLEIQIADCKPLLVAGVVVDSYVEVQIYGVSEYYVLGSGIKTRLQYTVTEV